MVDGSPSTALPVGARDWGCAVEEEGGGVREECKSFGVRGVRCSKFTRARNKFREKISESYAFGTFFVDI